MNLLRTSIQETGPLGPGPRQDPPRRPHDRRPRRPAPTSCRSTSAKRSTTACSTGSSGADMRIAVPAAAIATNRQFICELHASADVTMDAARWARRFANRDGQLVGPRRLRRQEEQKCYDSSTWRIRRRANRVAVDGRLGERRNLRACSVWRPGCRVPDLRHACARRSHPAVHRSSAAARSRS